MYGDIEGGIKLQDTSRESKRVVSVFVNNVKVNSATVQNAVGVREKLSRAVYGHKITWNAHKYV